MTDAGEVGYGSPPTNSATAAALDEPQRPTPSPSPHDQQQQQHEQQRRNKMSKVELLLHKLKKYKTEAKSLSQKLEELQLVAFKSQEQTAIAVKR